MWCISLCECPQHLAYLRVKLARGIYTLNGYTDPTDPLSEERASSYTPVEPIFILGIIYR